MKNQTKKNEKRKRKVEKKNGEKKIIAICSERSSCAMFCGYRDMLHVSDAPFEPAVFCT